MSVYTEYTYLKDGDTRIFTLSIRPTKEGQYPTVVMRNPYVHDMSTMSPEQSAEITADLLKDYTAHGYAVAVQHCRGYGLSTGIAQPFLYERRDGLQLLDWVRKQPFYNGEIFLQGGSYLAAVHYALAPYAEDIKGISLWVMTSELYELGYRNGVMKAGGLLDWTVGMYEQKRLWDKKTYSPDSFRTLPFRDFPQAVFGESNEIFEQLIRSTEPDDLFWREGYAGDYHRAVKSTRVPILFNGGFNDVIGGAMFRMWRDMDPEARAICAFVVSPNDHGDTHPENSIDFPDSTHAHFGDYQFEWFEAARGKRDFPFERGKITYYSIFDNCWMTDDFAPFEESRQSFPLGEETKTYTYNPYAPASFEGGLSDHFGGACFMPQPNSRYDVITAYLPPFEKDKHLKGSMKAELTVSSDRPDTAFILRVGISTEDGKDFALRDDIRTLVYELGDYKPGEKVTLHFEFDEYAFKIPAGSRLRVDITSSDAAHYIPHTNAKGLFSEQDRAFIAHNTVYLGESSLSLPIR